MRRAARTEGRQAPNADAKDIPVILLFCTYILLISCNEIDYKDAAAAAVDDDNDAEDRRKKKLLVIPAFVSKRLS